MLEYSANTAVKSAMARAHAERSQVLKQAWAWLAGIRFVPALRLKVSRWA